MSNTFIENREAWLRLSEIDYLGQFVKVWLSFNAWYRSAYTETQDRAIINELKWQANPVANVVRPLLEDKNSDTANQLRSDIGMLHDRLEHYELRTGKNDQTRRITLCSVYLQDHAPRPLTESSHGIQYRVELCTNRHIKCNVTNRQGRSLLTCDHDRHDISTLESEPGLSRLNTKQLGIIRLLYQQAAPRHVVDLTKSVSDSQVFQCGAFKFYGDRDTLFAAVVEIIYLMRCHLFHGELVPTKQANACYEPAYRIVRRFLEHVS